MACEGRLFLSFCGRVIGEGFGQVSGTHSKSKPPLGSQYLSFGRGATRATCARTPAWNAGLLMPHMARQLGGGAVELGAAAPSPGSYRVERGDTYLLARDEDCENMFHSSADHINVFNVAQVLGLDFQSLQVRVRVCRGGGPSKPHLHSPDENPRCHY